ncbi:MAG: Co2+/Mg2+ efflux protein ApaG [Planctomycetota bacterium]
MATAAEQASNPTGSTSPFGSSCLTHGIQVTVHPMPEPSHSSPEEHRYVFSYRVRIENRSDRRVQLLSRSWIIVDADGETKRVEGDGVVGERPILQAGESYEYASWCPLETPWGTMEGAYAFQAEPDELLRVSIARFYLVADGETGTEAGDQTERSGAS